MIEVESMRCNMPAMVSTLYSCSGLPTHQARVSAISAAAQMVTRESRIVDAGLRANVPDSDLIERLALKQRQERLAQSKTRPNGTSIFRTRRGETLPLMRDYIAQVVIRFI